MRFEPAPGHVALRLRIYALCSWLLATGDVPQHRVAAQDLPTLSPTLPSRPRVRSSPTASTPSSSIALPTPPSVRFKT